jgi:hypothetical protein
MSAPIDVSAQNAVLDAMLGDGHASGMPAAFQLAIFDGDPTGTGAELTSSGGYARVVSIANNSTNFPAADTGVKTGIAQTFPTSTAALSGLGKFWALFDQANPTIPWFYGQLSDVLNVGASGVGYQVTPRLFWNSGT